MNRLSIHIERPEVDQSAHPPDGAALPPGEHTVTLSKKAVCLTPEEERLCDLATD